MDPQSATLSVLTLMITPAVLISASGTLILSTSNRLSRVVDRVRDLADRTEELATSTVELSLRDERRKMIYEQLAQLIRRAKTLRLGLTILYLSVCCFILTSFFLGLIGLTWEISHWVPVATGLMGASALLLASLVLIVEAHLAARSLNVELDFIQALGELHAPTGVRPRRRSSTRV